MQLKYGPSCGIMICFMQELEYVQKWMDKLIPPSGGNI